MKIKNKIHPLELDAYSGFSDNVAMLNKSSSLYESNLVGYIATMLFVLIDFVCLYSVWNLVQTESAWLVRLIAIGCAVCLDVPMAIAALSLKRYCQKMMNKSTMLIIVIASIATFFITFIFSLWFRIETKDLTFEINGSEMRNNMLTETVSNDENRAIFVATLFNGIIPLCTSIASFVITFFASNPLKDKLTGLQFERIQLDSRMVDIKRALAEAERVKEYREYLIARESDLYNQFCAESKSIAALRKQATGIALNERLNDTDGITTVTESRKEILPQNTSDEIYDEAANVIKRKDD